MGLLAFPAFSKSEAEKMAGVHSQCLRGVDSTVIDVCVIQIGSWSDAKKESLRKKCAQDIGSSSLQFDSSYRGILVGLSFAEALLAQRLIDYLSDLYPSVIPWSG